MTKLILATTKQLFRNKQSLFWSLVFPIIFILLFSLFDFSGSVNANILVINRSDTEVGQAVIDVLQKVEGVGVNTELEDIEEAKDDLSNSSELKFEFWDEEEEESFEEDAQPNLVLVIPEGYGDFQKAAQDPDEKFEIEIFYNQAEEGQVSPSNIIASIISGVTDEIILSSAGAANPFEINREGVSVNEIGYYDILVPGVIGMGIMQSGIIGMAAAIAALKEKRILKRLSATPLAIWKFLLAEVIAFLILSMIQVTIMVVLAKYILGANIYGSIPLVYLLAFFGNFVFLNLGFITASVTKSTSAAEGFAQIFTTPMMFLSGVFFARETLPDVVKVIADYLPLSPLLDALRAVMLQNQGLSDIVPEITAIFVWTGITFFIAARLFKFREE